MVTFCAFFLHQFLTLLHQSHVCLGEYFAGKCSSHFSDSFNLFIHVVALQDDLDLLLDSPSSITVNVSLHSKESLSSESVITQLAYYGVTRSEQVDLT